MNFLKLIPVLSTVAALSFGCKNGRRAHVSQNATPDDREESCVPYRDQYEEVKYALTCTLNSTAQRGKGRNRCSTAATEMGVLVGTAKYIVETCARDKLDVREIQDEVRGFLADYNSITSGAGCNRPMRYVEFQ